MMMIADRIKPPSRCIIFQREKDKAELNPSMDITWEDAHKDVEPTDCEKMNANDYAYILIHLVPRFA